MARKPRGRGNGEGTVITFKKKGKIIGYAAEMTSVGMRTASARRFAARDSNCAPMPMPRSLRCASNTSKA
jgi:hypothetical protein